MKQPTSVSRRVRETTIPVVLTVVLGVAGSFAVNAQNAPTAQTNATDIRLREALRKKMAELDDTPVAQKPSTAVTNSAVAVKPAEEFKPLDPGEYNNWLEIGAGNFFVSGDRAQFQQRHSSPSGLFGGIEDFHWETPVQQKGLFTIDGRAMFDSWDYFIQLGIAHPDKGFLRVGYKQFRTWYDGSGGYFPPNRQWFNLYDDELALDRGEAWLEAGLALPDKPHFFFRYSHEFRNGKKDSTSWGDTALTGGLGTRGIVPSFWDIDERRDTFALDITHTVGKTDWGIGARVDVLHQNNARKERRSPGGLGTTVLGPNTSIDRSITHRDEVEADLYNLHAFTESRLNDRLLLTLGGSLTAMDTDITGSRIYGTDYDAIYDPLFARRQQRDEGFFDLSGGAQWKQYVGNVNLMWNIGDYLTLVPSFRFEHSYQSGVAEFTESEVGAGPAFTTTEEDLVNRAHRSFTDVSEALELRYTGLTNWVFYARAEWLEGQSNQKETQANDDLPFPSVTIQRDTDGTRFTQKYVSGINWYPLRSLNMAAQYYHKERYNDYDHLLDSTLNTGGDRYPAFLVAQNFKTDDVNYRITWRPCNFLTTVSRYDFQLSTINTRGDLLASVQSAEMLSHILSESLTITPCSWMYIQANGTYAFDRVNTPATSIGGAAANLVKPSYNSYWNASAIIGMALDKKTDLQFAYSYYEADDYVNNATVSTPYGAEGREHGITATLSRQLTKRLRWSLKYGYFDYNDVTSGGHNSYTAHLVYTSFQYRF